MKPLHAGAWAAWGLSVAAFAATISNPWGTVAALACVAIVHLGVGGEAGSIRAVVWAAALILGLRLVLIFLLPNPGETLLWSAPTFELPVWLGGLTFGGSVTAEVLAETVAEGLRLALAFVGFGVMFNRIDISDLIASVPGAFREAGLVVGVALGMIPGIAAAARDVSDAQQIRGERRSRILRPSMAVPILGSAVDRAFVLAESIDSRGYGKGSVRPSVALTATGSASALVGLAWWTAGNRPAGVALVVVGAALLWVAVVGASRRSLPTRLPSKRRRWEDNLVIVVAAVSVVVFVLMPGGWSAYPRFRAPAADAAVTFAALPLLSPFLVRAWVRR